MQSSSQQSVLIFTLCMCRCFFLGRKGCIELPLSKLGKLLRKFYLSNDFFARCRSRKEPFKKAPVSLKEFWEIDDLQLQKKVHRECSHMEHFQLTLVLSLEVGEKFFISTRTTFHFETFLCTQASFVESFLSIKTIGGIKLRVFPYIWWLHQVWQCVTCNTKRCQIQ